MHSLRRRHVEKGDDGFALIYAVLFIAMTLLLSSVVLALLVNQVKPTQFARKSQQTLDTAQAGLDAVLNMVRNSTNASGAGVDATLPCGASGTTVVGYLDAAKKQVYSVDIYYLTQNPGNLTLAQIKSSPGLITSCPLVVTPGYAYLVSHGSGPALPGVSNASTGNRVLHAVYQFKSTNTQATGGSISYNGECWDVGPITATTPAVGTAVTFQPCLTSGTPRQSWVYRPDLSMFWQGGAALGANLCLDYTGWTATTNTPVRMTLQQCAGTGTFGTSYDTVNQKFSPPQEQFQEFSSNFYVTLVNATGGDRNTSTCVSSTGNGSAGEQLVATASCGGQANLSFAPTVGSGAASGVTTGLPGATKQIVNYQYADHCIDVDDSNPLFGLITYPCHQAPDPQYVEANQQYSYSGSTSVPGTITTTRSGFYATVCFQSNGLAVPVSLPSCTAGAAAQQWQFTGLVPFNYAKSYNIVDYQGNCLTDLATGGSPVGTLGMQVCNGSGAQKWNAPPDPAASLLTGYGEDQHS